MTDDEKRLIAFRSDILLYYNGEKFCSWDTQSKRIQLLAIKYSVTPAVMAKRLKSWDQIIPREFENIIKSTEDNNVDTDMAEAETMQGFVPFPFPVVDEPADKQEDNVLAKYIGYYREETKKRSAITEIAKKTGNKPLTVALFMQDHGLEIPKMFSAENRAKLKENGTKGGNAAHQKSFNQKTEPEETAADDRKENDQPATSALPDIVAQTLKDKLRELDIEIDRLRSEMNVLEMKKTEIYEFLKGES